LLAVVLDQVVHMWQSARLTRAAAAAAGSTSGQDSAMTGSRT